MKIFISKYNKVSKKSIEEILLNFNTVGQSFFKDDKGRRNSIKVVEREGKKLNVKCFKRPNYINRYVYTRLRKSKAKRSFEYAEKLIEMGIGTPNPIAYAEKSINGALNKSFYISEHLDYDLTIRDIDLSKPGHEDILRAFTRFTYNLHENKIVFLDHSGGNTLINLNDGNYEFYLVDLNRMIFKTLSFNDRMKNFERLTSHRDQVEIMAKEYAHLLDMPENEVFNSMWSFVDSFFTNRRKNRNKKQKLKNIFGIK